MAPDIEQLACGQVWGGNRNDNVDLCTVNATTSLYSSAAQGGKGGDIYYMSVCNQAALMRIALVDVVGHGAAVSDLSQWLYESLRAHMNQLDTEQIVSEVNSKVIARGTPFMSTGIVAAVLPGEGSSHVVYAGHPPMLVYRASTGRWEALEPEKREDEPPANLPLGVIADTRFVPTETTLQTGDRLFLYTDGVIEAPAPSGELFGAQRLVDTLNSVAGRPLAEQKEGVLDRLRSHTGGSLDHDDVTFMGLELGKC